MWRYHPQWEIAHNVIESGRIGDVTFGRMHYSYDDSDPDSSRNNRRYGGGALRMIGCYPISMLQYLFSRKIGLNKFWPMSRLTREFGVDRLVSAVLDFGGSIGQISVSTQLWDEQTLTIYGKKGWMRLETPVTPAAGESPVIVIDDGAGGDPSVLLPQAIRTPQVDAVCVAIQEGRRPSLEDGVRVLDVLDAITVAAVGELPGWT